MNQYLPPTEIDLEETLSSLGMKYKTSGKELVLERCPFCERDRNKRSEHFSFNRQTIVYHCVKCSVSGNLITFKREMGLEPFEKKVYRQLEQEKVKAYSDQPIDFFQAMADARGIPADVYKKYEVGLFKDATLGMCRVYPFYDIDGKIVNVKYVNREKKMRTESDCKHVYFGLQFIDFTGIELNVTEGEDDALALVAMGFNNCVSIPFGANNYSEEMGRINARFKRINLFYDNDRAGEDGAENFARKAGIPKSWRVILPFKDARDCLKNGLDKTDIEMHIERAYRYEYKQDDKCRPALSFDDRRKRYEKDSKENIDGIKFGYKILDDITGGLRGGDVLTIVANPGAFKTTLLMNMIARGSEYKHDGISIFFSLEMSIEAEFERELCMSSHRPSHKLREMANAKTDEWASMMGEYDNSPLSRVYVSEESRCTVDQIIQIVKNTEATTGIKCILAGIDYIDYIEAQTQNEYLSVKEIMNGIKSKVARGLNIPVIILAQTSRENKDDDSEVGMRSGKGGTGLESASDFMIGLWMSGDNVVGRITKHRRIDSRYTGYKNPYLKLDIDSKNYYINDLQITKKPDKEAF
jgi:5S rRNA maturation endonuclease (ribonuclease M5)